MTTIRAIVPPTVKERILGKVTELAEAHGYLRQKRPANGRFIEDLVANPEVGGKLVEYLDRSRLKSYVKDALLKEYAESKRSARADPLKIVPQKIKGAVSIERKRDIYKFSLSGVWIVATCCSFKRWEIGVKKVALAASHFAPNAGRPRMVLLMHLDGLHMNSGDKKQAEHALAALGVDCFWC